MLPIYLDIGNTVDEFSFSQEEADSLSRYVIASVSKEYMSNWEKIVMNDLHQTKRAYLQGRLQEK